MGILDTLLKNADKLDDVAKFAADNPQIAETAMKYLGSGDSGGGLGGLLNSLQSGGLDDVVSSWLGSGENRSVNPEQLEAALGADRISEFAKDAGVSGSDAASVLAGMLPGIVDKLSPDGKLPETGGDLDQMLGGLFGKLN